MTPPEHAVELFSARFNCAQAVLTAFGPDSGVPEPVCACLAAPLGGGLARLGETCGAVSGALLVLGLWYGGATTADVAAKARMYDLAREFITRFKARHQSIVCRDLLGCDISTVEGWQQMQARKLHETLCPRFVHDAAEILEDMRPRRDGVDGA